MKSQNNNREPLPWILPLKRHETPISRLRKQIASILGIPSSRLYLTIGEYEELRWLVDDSAAMEKVLDIIQKDKAAGKFDKLCAMVDENNAWVNRHLLLLYDFLMEAYQRAK